MTLLPVILMILFYIAHIYQMKVVLKMIFFKEVRMKEFALY